MKFYAPSNFRALLIVVLSSVLATTAPSFASALAWSSSPAESKKEHHQPTVAVIGCGPSGMFFLHALASRRRMLEHMGDTEGLARLPASVTCFEKSSSLGGVWRSSPQRGYANFRNQTTQDNEEVGMYEALWTNGVSHMLEFSDYTFQEHFGPHVELPTYLPRQLVLKYMIARVTRNNPDFENNVLLNSAVISVTHDESRDKFEVKYRNEVTGEVATSYFDKCIWAAGQNGSPKTPMKTKELLDDGDFLGITVHASEVDSIDFGRAVKGKRVLMIGSGLSAEDLTLQAIKLGAERVYIQSRSGADIVDYMSAWPMNKVHILGKMEATEVIQGGRGIRFKDVEWDEITHKYEFTDRVNVTDVEDVYIVIYCTGYKPNIDMLEESLKRPYIKNTTFSGMPLDWKMKPNLMKEVLGEVKPSNIIWPSYVIPSDEIYRSLLIANPNFMYIAQMSSAPLLEIDAIAWLCLGYITGDVVIPSREEMQLRNAQDIIAAMNDPYMRYLADTNYYLAWLAFTRQHLDHWSNTPMHPDYLAMDRHYYDYDLRMIARIMRDGGYPLNIGDYEQLNEKGTAMIELYLADNICRASISTSEKGSLHAERKTFRDTVPLHASIHTGVKAVPFRKLWMDMANDEYYDLLGCKGQQQDDTSLQTMFTQEQQYVGHF